MPTPADGKPRAFLPGRAPLILLAALGLACVRGTAHAYKRHKNPRHHKPQAQGAAASPGAGEAKPAGPPPLLAPGRWDPAVRERIEEFIRSQGRDAPEYDPNSPPAAVFSVNGVLVVNDLGEALFQRMVLSSGTAPAFDFRMDDEFWQILPAAFGRQRLRADYEQLLTVPVSVWPDQPGYRRMRKDFVKMYRGFCAQRGRKECRALLARLFIGYTEDEAVTYVRDVLTAEVAVPAGYAFLEEKDSDPEPLRIRTGLVEVPEMLDLVRVLGNEGFDVWLLSEDAQIEVRQLAKKFGMPPERGIGIRIAVSSATALLTDEVEPPFPFRSGKVEAVLATIGKAPAFVAARGAEDAPLLSYGEGLRLLFDDGDESLRRVAVDRGWLIHPPFPPPP